MSYKIIKLN